MDAQAHPLMLNICLVRYNPSVLTMPYQHLTTKDWIEPHHIMCVSLDIQMYGSLTSLFTIPLHTIRLWGVAACADYCGV